jgi:hypothetical protein
MYLRHVFHFYRIKLFSRDCHKFKICNQIINIPKFSYTAQQLKKNITIFKKSFQISKQIKIDLKRLQKTKM